MLTAAVLYIPLALLFQPLPAMAIRVCAVVAATSLSIIAMLLVAATADAIDVGDTCPCAKVSGIGRCIRWESGPPDMGVCSFHPCGPAFKCAPEGEATHLCLAQAGSGSAIACKGPVSPYQQGCQCTATPRTGPSTPTLVPVQTTPTGCTSNDNCEGSDVCVSGTCEAVDTCSNGKNSLCDKAYQDQTGLKNGRGKCCPPRSQCAEKLDAGSATVCAVDCGKMCTPICSLSKISTMPQCSQLLLE